MIESHNRGAAEDALSACIARWSQPDTLMNAVVKRIVWKTLFKSAVVRYIKQLVNATIEECTLT